jgi:hypothetical protein
MHTFVSRASRLFLSPPVLCDCKSGGEQRFFIVGVGGRQILCDCASFFEEVKVRQVIFCFILTYIN